jgi:hypothetical protein
LIFSFGHCVVCSSSIYEFWLPLWYIQTLLIVCSIKCLYKRLWVPCCDVRYDFRMKTMLGSSFPPVVCRMVDVLFLFYMCLFTHSGVQHILCCVFVLHCLRLVFVLNVASFSGLSILDCPFGFYFYFYLAIIFTNCRNNALFW